MGKLNVSILRYLNPEDFRVLTGVSVILALNIEKSCIFIHNVLLSFKCVNVHLVIKS